MNFCLARTKDRPAWNHQGRRALCWPFQYYRNMATIMRASAASYLSVSTASPAWLWRASFIRGIRTPLIHVPQVQVDSASVSSAIVWVTSSFPPSPFSSSLFAAPSSSPSASTSCYQWVIFFCSGCRVRVQAERKQHFLTRQFFMLLDIIIQECHDAEPKDFLCDDPYLPYSTRSFQSDFCRNLALVTWCHCGLAGDGKHWSLLDMTISWKHICSKARPRHNKSYLPKDLEGELTALRWDSLQNMLSRIERLNFKIFDVPCWQTKDHGWRSKRWDAMLRRQDSHRTR